MNITQSITRAVGSTKIWAKRNSPHILIGAGIVLMLGGTVVACASMKKVQAIKEEVDNQYDLMKLRIANEPEYTDELVAQDVTKVRMSAAGYYIRAFAPAVVLSGLGVASILMGHRIMCRRYIAAVAAFNALSKQFKAYRERVAEEIGVEKEQAIYDGAKQDLGLRNEDSLAEKLDFGSIYSRYFDEQSTEFIRTPMRNKMFLIAMENRANFLLLSRGHIFLNDVYDLIGLPKSKIGQQVGWVLNGPNSDNKVSFGFNDSLKAKNANFHEGVEPYAYLDFNVDGSIIDIVDFRSHM